jgi:hypothetical protein
MLYVTELQEVSKKMTQHWYNQMGITAFESGEELIAFKFGHTRSPKSYRSKKGAVIKLLTATSEHRCVFGFAARPCLLVTDCGLPPVAARSIRANTSVVELMAARTLLLLKKFLKRYCGSHMAVRWRRHFAWLQTRMGKGRAGYQRFL